MPFLQRGELTLHYRIAGSGEKLLFIPGTMSDLRGSESIFSTPLVEHFEILSFDPRGIGQSNSPDEEVTMKTYSDDVKWLLDALGWQRCNCLGESFGGMVAQQVVLDHSKYFIKLALAATSSGGKGGASYPFHQHDLSAMSLDKRVAFWIEKCDLRAQDPLWQQHEPVLYHQQYDYYKESMQYAGENPDYKINSQRQIHARKGHNTFERLYQLTLPTYDAKIWHGL
ncbi:alpha/beta fold hydrolase [Shewanella surugensis]|uniref:Alpha/beta hydrolase n=1 Tax=Shewanella surugensis TaxID=212020 RepID=A0ABT0LBM7_9GAMM|nr:alpha/beta hydrolase [Shewanella surugensis]MCL1124752.1 alpha/beta hydrolase [Shewanella surugensis]